MHTKIQIHTKNPDKPDQNINHTKTKNIYTPQNIQIHTKNTDTPNNIKTNPTHTKYKYTPNKTQMHRNLRQQSKRQREYLISRVLTEFLHVHVCMLCVTTKDL